MKLFILILIPFFTISQDQQIFFLGNTNDILLVSVRRAIGSLPEELDQFDAIFIFSGAQSMLQSNDLERLENYLSNGGGLYVGAENWPLQAEANQITSYFYQKECFGNHIDSIATSETYGTNLVLEDMPSIPAGVSTVSFPLHPGLKVEAWVNDEPLILSGIIGNGRIVIDGGYSRFYKKLMTPESELVWTRILEFLIN